MSQPLLVINELREANLVRKQKNPFMAFRNLKKQIEENVMKIDMELKIRKIVRKNKNENDDS
jgi:hypothetical protein